MDQALFDVVVVGAYAMAGLVVVGVLNRRCHCRQARFAAATTAALAFASPVLAEILGLRFNVTGSMPIGVYRVVQTSPQNLHLGSAVAFCAPRQAAHLGTTRGYLTRGNCPDGSEPLVKFVVGLPGDNLSISRDGVRTRDCLLLWSAPLDADSGGRRLGHWRFGGTRVPDATLWVYGESKRSWDSRYWGPVPTRNVLAVVVPILVTPSGSAGDSFAHRCRRGVHTDIPL